MVWFGLKQGGKICPENRLILLKTSFGETEGYSTPEKQ